MPTLTRMLRILALLVALTLTAGCSYIQMQQKNGGQPTPYAPRLPWPRVGVLARASSRTFPSPSVALTSRPRPRDAEPALRCALWRAASRHREALGHRTASAAPSWLRARAAAVGACPCPRSPKRRSPEVDGRAPSRHASEGTERRQRPGERDRARQGRSSRPGGFAGLLRRRAPA